VLTLRELEAQITELAGHLNAANYRWLSLIAEFDRRHGCARRADGLGRTAESFLQHGSESLSSGDRHRIIIHVEADSGTAPPSQWRRRVDWRVMPALSASLRTSRGSHSTSGARHVAFPQRFATRSTHAIATADSWSRSCFSTPKEASAFPRKRVDSLANLQQKRR
jgi:hypothetical protein